MRDSGEDEDHSHKHFSDWVSSGISEEKKRKSDAIVSWIGVISLIIAGIFSYLEYRDKLKKDKIVAIQEYISDFNSQDLREAQRIISDHWRKHKKEIEKIDQKINRINENLKSETLSETRRLYWEEKKNDAWIESRNFQILHSEGMYPIGTLKDNNERSTEARDHIWKMISFYTSVAICEKEGICDRETSHAFFGRRALEFYQYNYYYIQYIRCEGYKDTTYAYELEEFVSRYKYKIGKEKNLGRKRGKSLKVSSPHKIGKEKKLGRKRGESLKAPSPPSCECTDEKLRKLKKIADERNDKISLRDYKYYVKSCMDPLSDNSET